MAQPVLSVLMPVLNEEASLVAAVTSVLRQVDSDDVEVLVIDGRSADATLEIAKRLAADDERVRIIDNPGVIIPAGLNAGLRAARGEFVARVDGHGELNQGYLSAALQRLSLEPDLAGVGGKKVGFAHSPVGKAIALVLASRFGVGNSINHYADSVQRTDHASFGVYRKAAARLVGGWDETLLVNEDVDFDHRLIRAGYGIGYDPAMVFLWHVRETLPGLFRQYRRYGRGKAAMVRKNGRRAVRLRHAVPPAVVGGSVLLLASAVVWPVALVGFVPYLALVLFASMHTWRSADQEATALVAIPAAFATAHFAWGVGFLEGLLLTRRPALASGNAASRPTS